MDNTFLQMVSLIVSLSNQITQLQQENAALKAASAAQSDASQQ